MNSLRLDNVIQSVVNQIQYFKQLKYDIPRLADGTYVITPDEIDGHIAHGEDLLDRLQEIKKELEG